MKKAIAIIILGLFWCNVGFTMIKKLLGILILGSSESILFMLGFIRMKKKLTIKEFYFG